MKAAPCFKTKQGAFCMVRARQDRCLQDLVHSRVPVCVIKAGAVELIVIAAQHFLPRVHLRQAHPNNGAADEPVSHKVHAFPKDTAQYAKSQQRFLRSGYKLRQKLCAVCIAGTALLHKGPDRRIPHGKILMDLLQVGIAWEKHKIVSNLTRHQCCQRI